MPKTDKAKVDPLESWHRLQELIHGLNETQLADLIERELEGKARRNMVMRMFMKANKLRYRREREVYEKRIKAANAKKR